MRNDPAGARSPLPSLAFEDAAERELARMEGILSGQSHGGLIGHPAMRRGAAMRSKNRLAALGLIGCLGTIGTLSFPPAISSLGIAPRTGTADPEVSLLQTASPPSILADTPPDVQSGRSTSVAETGASQSIARVPLPLRSKMQLPAARHEVVKRTTTQRAKTTRGFVSKRERIQVAVRPVGSRRELIAGAAPRFGRASTENRLTARLQKQCQSGLQICRPARWGQERDANRSRGPKAPSARVASRRGF